MGFAYEEKVHLLYFILFIDLAVSKLIIEKTQNIFIL